MKYKLTLKVILLFSLLAVATIPTTSADYKSGNTELLDAINVAIKDIVNSGQYDTIYSNWFSGDVVLTDDSNASTATTYPTATTGGTLASVISKGKIVFGSDTSYAPFEYMDGSKVVGFDAEIADAIAAALSTQYGATITAEMKTNAWTSIIPDLQAGTFDAILSAMTKTAERAQEVQFTRAYYTSKQGILASATSDNITGVKDLDNAAYKIGVQTGTTSDLFAASNLTKASVKGYATIDVAIAALAAGDVDYVLGDLPTIAFYSVENPEKGLSVVGSFGADELFGIAVRYDTATSTSTPLGILPIIFTLASFATIVYFKRRN